MGMRHAKLIFKTYRIKRALGRYKVEKENALRIARNLKTKPRRKDKIRRLIFSIRNSFKRCLKNVFLLQGIKPFRRFIQAINTKGTLHNYILKSIFGFLGGMLLTYIFFIFFVFTLNFSMHMATLWCGFAGIILSLGLAFSIKVRCIVFLLIPQFFSTQGRQAMIAYAFILVLTGPGKNMVHNGTVLSESLACGQEQVKIGIKHVIEAIKKPLIAIWEAFKNIMKKIKQVALKIKSMLVAIKRLIMTILRIYISVFQWLGSIINFCNKKVGTPFQRCIGVFQSAIVDCRAALGPIFNWLCSIGYLQQNICYLVKHLDYICMFFSFVTDSLIGPLKKKIKLFMRHVRNAFYVSVSFHHDYNFETTQNKNFKDIATGILGDAKEKVGRFLAVFDIMSFITSFFFLFMLIKALQYQHKYMINDRFDNKYITREFIKLNMVRAQKNLETLLPLTRRERAKYIQVTSLRLVHSEKVKLTRAAIILGFATLKLTIHMVSDYCLFWVLDLIRFHGQYSTHVEGPGMVGVRVQGSGVLVDLYKSILKAFKFPEMSTDLNSIPCLPEPLPPDYNRYIQIVILIVTCWVSAIGEPYGLRVRQGVMALYHPDRSRQRIVWLYNHIMRCRGGFLKFARRQLRRKFTKDMGIEKVSLSMRIREMCPFLNILFGPLNIASCMVCARTFRTDKPKGEKLIKCSSPGCPGAYCAKCYKELNNLCTICREPVEYGDLSDLSEEKDSSDLGPPPIQQPPPLSSDEEANLIAAKDVMEKSDTSSGLSYSYQSKPLYSPVKPNSNPEFEDIEKNNITILSTLSDLATTGDENIERRMDLKRSVRFKKTSTTSALWGGLRTLGRGILKLVPLWSNKYEISDDESSGREFLHQKSRTDTDTSTGEDANELMKKRKKILKKRSMSNNFVNDYNSSDNDESSTNWSDNNNDEHEQLIQRVKRIKKKNKKYKKQQKKGFWFKIKSFFNFFKFNNNKQTENKFTNVKLLQKSSSESSQGGVENPNFSYDSPNSSSYSESEMKNIFYFDENSELKNKKRESFDLTTIYSKHKLSSSSQDVDENSDEIENLFQKSKLEFAKDKKQPKKR